MDIQLTNTVVESVIYQQICFELVPMRDLLFLFMILAHCSWIRNLKRRHIVCRKNKFCRLVNNSFMDIFNESQNRFHTRAILWTRLGFQMSFGRMKNIQFQSPEQRYDFFFFIHAYDFAFAMDDQLPNIILFEK